MGYKSKWSISSAFTWTLSYILVHIYYLTSITARTKQDENNIPCCKLLTFLVFLDYFLFVVFFSPSPKFTWEYQLDASFFFKKKN